MVTFSENFKQQVADAYLDKVEVTEATLSSSTIVMKNITFADEGCYICTFNVYPSGTERRKTCLTVQGKAGRDPRVNLLQRSGI
uniref:Immunoglobulin V-set domain-containing protein n=1 Tax=Pygocentrus nattereri TaxID=42514 RepID=A0AAR2LI82_PYGNA